MKAQAGLNATTFTRISLDFGTPSTVYPIIPCAFDEQCPTYFGKNHTCNVAAKACVAA
jgi:hypothetical protein